ncbi:Lrp/AsnC ligand binding domain-containing protein [Altericroceibacterium endophyticum]|uniref:Winged helix-turn-helix transcriptional regulator n=1 Tax=Altericroceibacterium endophyticum TaxID=1808508 RepID=A0A6I4T675_9SPHN|nr:winged helix-turn-helix transcriptional regulator [Altericroceibacterium endophyticum]
MELDNYDCRILEQLQQSGDMGPVEMSEHVALSPSQCSRRMQQLRKAGLIRRVAAVLDAEKLGLSVSAYVLITLSSHDPEWLVEFHERIAGLEEVVQCQALTGEADILLKIVTSDLRAFNRVMSQDILQMRQIRTARSSIVLEDLKNTTQLPLKKIQDSRRIG